MFWKWTLCHGAAHWFSLPFGLLLQHVHANFARGTELSNVTQAGEESKLDLKTCPLGQTWICLEFDHCLQVDVSHEKEFALILQNPCPVVVVVAAFIREKMFAVTVVQTSRRLFAKPHGKVDQQTKRLKWFYQEHQLQMMPTPVKW